ncbi:MAG: hypothetical protein WCK85_09800 [Chlorobium sp.]
MKTEIKVTIIGGVLAIIGGVLPVILGWYAPKPDKEKSSPPPATQSAPVTPGTPERVTTITGGNVNYSERDMTINNGTALKSVDALKPNLATIIRTRDLQAAKASPLFRKLVRDRFGKEIEQLDRQQMATFWQEMAKYLIQQRRLKQ